MTEEKEKKKDVLAPYLDQPVIDRVREIYLANFAWLEDAHKRMGQSMASGYQAQVAILLTTAQIQAATIGWME